ncbi:hypothetical protein PRUPE_1G083600 [Prunus persica]|uniref:DUF8040 domain-containing protein n=1 Tax=Prunus persica TaxID=3760 RepID=A0A251QUI4_PRUPE|nr:hypothetical protein PRUPE_1G083600 [Prunus persica]
MGGEVNCIEQLQVSKNVFKSLCTILQGSGGLTQTRNVSIKESVAIFLNILLHNLKFRVIGFVYYYSEETNSPQFNNKYYLVDAGYANGQGFLAPYIGTRYHLNEWTRNNRPREIINACFVLHNFIPLKQHNDPVLQDHDWGITSVQVTDHDQWTTFRGMLALQMFHDYQA